MTTERKEEGEEFEEADSNMGIYLDNEDYLLGDEFQSMENKKQAEYFKKKMKDDGCDSINQLITEVRENARPGVPDSDKWQIVQNAIERGIRDAECGSGSIYQYEDDELYKSDDSQTITRRKGVGNQKVEAYKEEENSNRGIQQGDKRCSAIGFKHNKRMFYLQLDKTDEEIQKMSKEEQKKLLKAVKDKIRIAKQNGKVNDIAFTKLKDFEKNFGNKPTADDFEAVDKELDEKCSNIIDLHPFLPENPAEMGGHPGAFVNIYVTQQENGGKCDIFGGKKWVDDSVTEYEFYQFLYKKENPNKLFENFKKYIAEFKPDSLCKPSNPMIDKDPKVLKELDYYIPMSNAKNTVRKGKEKIHYFDFKLGYKTAFLHEKGKKGVENTPQRDQQQSISNEIGFRAEGSTLVNEINNISPKFQKESGWHPTTKEGMIKGKVDPQKYYKSIEILAEKIGLNFAKKIHEKQKPDQYKLYLLNPGYIYDVLFYNTPDKHVEEFCKKLKLFEKEVIEENFKAFHGEKQHAIAFIGCSILLVNGGKGIDFKLIDFAHPYVLASESIDTAVKVDDEQVKHRVLVDDDESCCSVNKYTIIGPNLKWNGSSKKNKLAVGYDYNKKEAKKMMKDAQKNYAFDWKTDIDYHRWRHTFENFMGGLIAFVYSLQFWANSRLYYDSPQARETKHNQLIQEFKNYNQYFGNEMKEPTNEKAKKKYDPPYPFSIEHKDEKLKVLIEKSLSNLSRF